MPGRLLPGAMCVQRFDDSLNSAIHITYRISLRSSSMPEPRDPLLVSFDLFSTEDSETANKTVKRFGYRPGGPPPGTGGPGRGGGPLGAPARRSNDLGNVRDGLGSFATL